MSSIDKYSAHVNANASGSLGGWPREFWQRKCCSLVFPPYHELSLLESPTICKISTFLPFLMSEFCYKELLLSESPLLSDKSLSESCG